MAARASTPDQALEVKWDNHLWVYLFDACFDQVVDSLTLHRREKKSISASTVRAKIKKVDAIVTPKSEEQPEILYLESQLPCDEKHFAEDRDKLFKLMKAELIWRISRKISTLVLGMMTQGACVHFLFFFGMYRALTPNALCKGPAVQLYLMDLCTYDSLMVVKVADLSLYHNKQADLASFLDVAVQMLAARARNAACTDVDLRSCRSVFTAMPHSHKMAGQTLTLVTWSCCTSLRQCVHPKRHFH
jgi:hypothetical protein